MKAIRARVSGSRVRYMKEGFDLDLTYITPSLIAMGYPASGMEKTYRNDITEVAAFLDSRHPRAYRVYNLSERKYDYGKFHNAVNECGFPDHHPPPLQLLLDIINDMLQWTAQSDENVVVVHCLAGKGRTGVVCSCFLLLTGLYGNLFAIRSDRELRQLANTAIRDFWNARGQGVRYPSQALYIYYFLRVVRRLRKLPREIPRLRPAKKMLLKRVVLNGIPDYDAPPRGGCTPFLQVLPAPSQHEKPALLYNSSWQNPNFETYAADPTGSIVFETNCVLQGDVVIRGFHANPVSMLGRHVVQMFHVTFNTDFFRKNCDLLRLRKKEVDEAHDNKRFPESFSLDCYIEPVVDADDVFDDDDGDEELLGSQRLRALDEELSPTRDPLSSVRRSSVQCTNANGMKIDDQATRRSSLVQRESSFQPKPDATKMGWLYKQGGFIKSWKKRWFVARDGQLTYFERASDPTPLGVVDLHGVRVDTAFPEETTARNKYLHYFKVIPCKREHRTWYFGADSEQEMAQWLRALAAQSCHGMELASSQPAITSPPRSAPSPASRHPHPHLQQRRRASTTNRNSESSMLGINHQRSSTFNDHHFQQPPQRLSDSRVMSRKRNSASSMIDLTASTGSNLAQRGSFGLARSPPPNMKTHQVARVSTNNVNDAFYAQSLDSSSFHASLLGSGCCSLPSYDKEESEQENAKTKEEEEEEEDDDDDDYTPFLSSAHAPPSFARSQPLGSTGTGLLLSELDRQTVLQSIPGNDDEHSGSEYQLGMYIYTADELQTAAKMQQYVIRTTMEAGRGSGVRIPIVEGVKMALERHDFEYAQQMIAQVVLLRFPSLVDAMESNPAMFVDTICCGDALAATTSSSSLASAAASPPAAPPAKMMAKPRRRSVEVEF